MLIQINLLKVWLYNVDTDKSFKGLTVYNVDTDKSFKGLTVYNVRWYNEPLKQLIINTS